MKVLSISNTDIWPWGEHKGIPSIFASQKGFVENGHVVYFLCPQKHKDLPRKVDYEGITIYRFKLPFKLDFASISSIPVDTFPGHLKATVLFNLEWFFFQIYSFIRAVEIASFLKPDIIYVHSLVPAFCGFLISRLFNARLVIRVYGTRDLYWKWQSFWFRIKELRDYLAFKIPADYFIITNDGTLADLLAKKLGVRDKKIKYWRNGIEQDIYEPVPDARKGVCRDLKISPSVKIIASTSRLVPDYGADKLLYGLVDLFAKKPEAVCLIAGSGPERKRLEEFARRVNISSRVSFLGVVDRETIKKILNAADIFVFLSRYHNCTNTMWEAMASGKCIVTTENEAIKEVLTSGENAILISPHNLESLPGILEELLNDDDLRDRLGRNARFRAQKVLKSWSERIEKEARLLEGLVGE